VLKARGWLLTLMTVAVIGAGLYVYQDYRIFLDTPLTVPPQGVTFEVKSGDSIAVIAQQLEQRGVLDSARSALYLQVYARLERLAHRIQVGEYAIKPGMTPRNLMAQVAAGRVVQYALTLVEGWTFQQMLAAVAGHEKIEQTLQGLDEAQIMARLGHPDLHPEGRFFPDTYHFPAGTTDLAFLQRAFETLQRRLQQAWAQRAADLPLKNPDQALILASIIEKETAVPSERREIAGVFVRRLRKGMRLQTDPTVIYGLGKEFDGNLRRADLKRDTPYNTYTRPGLPPTPIALPGGESIAAAVNPAAGDTLYFVARGDGSHVFSRTLAEHNRWVRRYQLNKP
jgi:UPF0755 protein